MFQAECFRMERLPVEENNPGRTPPVVRVISPIANPRQPLASARMFRPVHRDTMD